MKNNILPPKNRFVAATGERNPLKVLQLLIFKIKSQVVSILRCFDILTITEMSLVFSVQLMLNMA